MLRTDVSFISFQCIRSSYVNSWPMKCPITFTYLPLYIHLVLLQEKLCLFPRPLYDAMFSVGYYIRISGICYLLPSMVKGMTECCNGITMRRDLRRNCVVVLHCIVWSIWRQRNRRFFEGIEFLACMGCASIGDFWLRNVYSLSLLFGFLLCFS